MVMIPGELIAAANHRENMLVEKNNELTLKLLQVTQTLAAMVEYYGVPVPDGKCAQFPSELLEKVFFDPMVAISHDNDSKMVMLVRPNVRSIKVKTPTAPPGFDPNWQQP